MMISARQKDGALLEDVERATGEQPEALHVWWLGQSGFLVACEGKRILFDPYLSDSLTRKYAGTEKEHIRMSERVVAPELLRSIDVVTSTHNHTDHLDKETLDPLLENNPAMRMVFPEANRAIVAERLGIDPVDTSRFTGMDAGETVSFDGINITGFPAAHDALEKDDHGRCRFLGFVAKMGNWTVYHSGDTRPISGLADILKPHCIDLAMLPINGALEERKVAGNLWGQEAAALADNAGIGWVIPCHYDMFTFNTETPTAFIEACERRGQKYRVLSGGERLTLGEPSSPEATV